MSAPSATRAQGNPGLLADLERIAPGGVSDRASARLRHAHDASHYLLVPQAVVTPQRAEDIAGIVRVAAHHGVSVAFRSGGTSLSGQAGTDGLLLDTRRHFRSIEVLDDGARVRVQPGATVRQVNNRLRPYRRKLGPDPASESACTVGGVIANNSSGMLCGTRANTYQTIESAILVLTSGTVVNTADRDADDQLRHREPDIYRGLTELRDRVRNNERSRRIIEKLFALKNTMGYGVNAFVDFDSPVDLLLHLAVGSEGTLVFVAEAVFRTVPDPKFAATSLLLFPDLDAATGVLPTLVDSGLDVIELLDSTSLRVAQANPASTADLRELEVSSHAALLVEHHDSDELRLVERVAGTQSAIVASDVLDTPSFTRDAATRGSLWGIRKGLYATVASARPAGASPLLEDIAVPVAQLLPTCTALTALFAQHNYRDNVIFGHAKDGNIHFVVNEDFSSAAGLDRYLNFTEDMVELVLAHGGTLKAEHGTGRLMAPYVARQYGDELWQVMRDLKNLMDPKNVLNPGVLITDDPRAHVRHLKTTPPVEEEVDKCVDCGYCEPVCPSKDLTTTPRQRIALRREIRRAHQLGNDALAAELEHDYEYDATQTCAVDSLCQLACPVDIDTGALTRRLRSRQHTSISRAAWSTLAKHWDVATRAAGHALTAAKALPNAAPVILSTAGRALIGTDAVPRWSVDLPRGGTRRQPKSASDPVAVYFPACLSTMFGAAECSTGVHDAFLALCERAGIAVTIPGEIASLCCATPWKSKGFDRGQQHMHTKVASALQAATKAGALPVVVDAASCTEGLQTLLNDDGLTVIDATTFVEQTVLAHLPTPVRVDSLAVHRTCSTARLGIDPTIRRLASVIADEVIDPTEWACCGFAGDRGLLHPELTAAATAAEAEEIGRHAPRAYASVNRTCEIAMTRATGAPYVHILELLEHATRQTTSAPTLIEDDHPPHN
ncbi:FAD-binding oxidoreductase [Mycobacterium sp. WY10]|nr:FAD-binding oxidoreductase [Mycobacterium sp. WY10]